MRGEGAATLRAAMAQPSTPKMGAANTRSPAMYSESEIAYPAVRTAPSFSSISSSVTGVCSLTFTRRLKPRMRPHLGARKERQNAMADRCAIGRNAASHPYIHAEPSLPLLIALDVHDLVSIQNANAGGFSHRANEGAQLRLRDGPKVHASDRIKAEFEWL